jgi:hypothetical protein
MKQASIRKSETEDAGNSEFADERKSETISDHRASLKLPGMKKTMLLKEKMI